MPIKPSAQDKLSRDKHRTQIFKGMAELALLRLLNDGPEYGLRILDGLREAAGLKIAEGTLYPLLYRLEKGGFIAAEWRILDNASHPRKYYSLTEPGRAELETQLNDWLAISEKLQAFLNRGDQ
jgi:PadR family transcriptional regulator PadR